MSIFRKIKLLMNDPFILIRKLSINGIFSWMDDETYQKWEFKNQMGYKLNIKTPNSFNEKIQWLKINYRHPLMTIYADKYRVRRHVSKKIGQEYLNELFGVYENVNDINLDTLPESFVLKANHSSGQNLIVENKSDLDWDKEKNRIKKWLKTNWYYEGRQWAYKNIKPKILAEKYLIDEENEDLKDYKIFCFDGEPKIIQIDSNRADEHTQNIYDVDLNLLDVTVSGVQSKKLSINNSKNIKKMLDLSKELSEGFPHARIDFYDVNGRIIFGEITFYHQNGLAKFDPVTFDKKMGDWLKLPDKI